MEAMIEVEPSVINFPSVSLRKEYKTNVTIVNKLAAEVHLHLISSSSYFRINPSELRLSPKQAIIITVRLWFEHDPEIRMLRNDYVSVKLADSDQTLLHIPIKFSLAQTRSRSTSRSPTPSQRKIAPQSKSRRSTSEDINTSSSSLLQELHASNMIKDHEIHQLKDMIGDVHRKYPDHEDIVDAVRKKEQHKYEERSQKVRFSLPFSFFVLFFFLRFYKCFD
jgi:hypothetical protein